SPSTNTKYDLEERTAKFGENTILLCKKVQKNVITVPLVNQLIKCATSIGANYCEADDAESRKDFKHKIGICKKESRESKHFLRMLAVATPEYKEEVRHLWKEARELNLIFNKIFLSTSGVRN
ncbi:MAG: four helix bundle protein, partial [Patescibacteria group bacterium]